MDGAAGAWHGGAPAGSPVMPSQLDERLREKIEFLNTSGRHVTNLTNINGTTYADVEVRRARGR
jgi:hypothetical protein